MVQTMVLPVLIVAVQSVLNGRIEAFAQVWCHCCASRVSAQARFLAVVPRAIEKTEISCRYGECLGRIHSYLTASVRSLHCLSNRQSQSRNRTLE